MSWAMILYMFGGVVSVLSFKQTSWYDQGPFRSCRLDLASAGKQQMHFVSLLLGWVIRDPRSLLLLGRAVECLCAPQSLHIEVCDVGLGVRKLEANLLLRGRHHLILVQPTRTVKGAED